MRPIDKLRNYILDEEFKIMVLKNKVNIVNYESIGHFDSNKIIIRYTDGDIIIKGIDLVVSKLLNDEILITGEIKSLELR